MAQSKQWIYPLKAWWCSHQLCKLLTFTREYHPIHPILTIDVLFPLVGWLIETCEETPLTTGFYDDRWDEPAPGPNLFLPKGHCWYQLWILEKRSGIIPVSRPLFVGVDWDSFDKFGSKMATKMWYNLINDITFNGIVRLYIYTHIVVKKESDLITQLY